MLTIDLSLCRPINGASVDENRVLIETHPGSGAYSAVIPISRGPEQAGPCGFDISLEVIAGSVSVAALASDQLSILAERVFHTLGHEAKTLSVPDVQEVSALLVRNAATDSSRSKVRLGQIATRPIPRFAYVNAPAHSRSFTLPLRRSVPAFGGTEDAPLRGGGYVSLPMRFTTENTAVIVIDAWASHPLAGWAARAASNIQGYLRPALDAFRAIGVRIIHSASDWPVHPLAEPLPGEAVIEGGISHRHFAAGLRTAGVSNLIYMGYSSNRCVLNRPIGIMKMFAEQMSIAFVRDASIGEENADTLRDERLHAAIVEFLDALSLGTLAVRDIISAVEAPLET
jgi:hypothetical protein